jgi:hypothetical protein
VSGYPHFVEQTKASSGMFKQKYHLIGALVHGRGMWVYTMSHKFPADPNVTIEVLQRVLTDLSDESGGPLPKKLCLQMDNCVRENKNQALFAYLGWLVQRKVFASIEVSFLPVGHTHEDIDQVWSRTSIQMKVNNVCCEEELFAVIKAAFHHCGLQARCGSIKSVANLKGWLLSHCEPVAGLAGREILHFLIQPHADGPAIFTKHRAHNTWQDRGHVYDTPSGGFHQLHANVPLPPFAAGTIGPTALKPKVQTDQLIKRLQSALLDCEKDDRVSADAWTALTASLGELTDTRELPFSWLLDGQLLCERAHYNLGHVPAAFAPMDAMARDRLAALELKADDVDAERAAAAERDSDNDTEAEEGDDRAVPAGLRTAAQEDQRKQAAAAAEQEQHFHVDELMPGHFVVFEPDSEARLDEDGAHSRLFWVGRVYDDWVDPDSGELQRGVHPATGLITVHNYTPYNVSKGAASSNTVANPYGDYTPEYDTSNRDKWTTCYAKQVLLQLSHLIPHANNPPGEPTATSRHYFKLPAFAKSKLRAHPWRAQPAKPAKRAAAAAGRSAGRKMARR